MTTKTLNNVGQDLVQGLERLSKYETAIAHTRASKEKINVVGAGGAVTAAYEQLRNAAENTEEHLLLQNAIKRFFTQLFVTRDEELINNSGSELAIELTLAGYVQNDSLTSDELKQISTLANKFYKTYSQLTAERSVGLEKSAHWTIDVLAVQSESIISNHAIDKLFLEFAYKHFLENLPQKKLFEKNEAMDYGAALYVATSKVLLKSDDAVVRAALLERYQTDTSNLAAYIEMNRHIDNLLTSKTTSKLFHVVDRRGAPLRILRRLMESNTDIVKLLKKRDSFLDLFEQQVNKEYSHVSDRVNRAVVRSVIFLIITKFLIGIAIEVPYDLWAHDKILWLPLVINLFFPPVYMVMLRFTNTLPSHANTTALVDRIDQMLYGDKELSLSREFTGQKRYSSTFSAAYGLLSLIVFGLVVWGLLALQFSFVHIAIFFVFISAASFLGFRLSRLIRELEVVHSSQNGTTFIRDIIYLPFVVVGRWMSDKYARVNIVTLILDMLIELPLKTILRLVRQWSMFIDDRKDRL